eukprot:scaffold9982_cov22-Tisochrysis_lutea.AAC.5
MSACKLDASTPRLKLHALKSAGLSATEAEKALQQQLQGLQVRWRIFVSWVAFLVDANEHMRGGAACYQCVTFEALCRSVFEQNLKLTCTSSQSQVNACMPTQNRQRK